MYRAIFEGVTQPKYLKITPRNSLVLISLFLPELPQWMIDSELVDSKPPLYSSFEWMCGAYGGPQYKWYRNGVEIFKRYNNM